MTRMREVDPKTAHDEMKADPAAVYLDVRTPAEYDQGHPDGAWNLPILFAGMLGMKPNPDFVAVALKVLPKDAPIFVGCKSGQRSAMACQVLEQAGFTNLANVAGGYHGGGRPGWLPLGLPCSDQPTPGKAWDDLRA